MTHWIQPVVSLEHGKSLDAWDDESLDPARTMLAQEFVSQAGRFMTILRVAFHGDSLGENRPQNGQNKSGLEMFGIYVVFVQMFFTQHPLLAVQTGPKAVKWHHALHSLVRLQMSCCFIIHLPYIIFLSALFALCHGVVVSLSHSETESKSWPCGFRSPGPGLLLLLGQTGHEFSYVFVHFPNRFSMNVPVSTRFCPWFSRRISVWVAAVPPTSSRKPWNWSSAVTPPWTPWVRCRRALRSAWVPAAWRSTRAPRRPRRGPRCIGCRRTALRWPRPRRPRPPWRPSNRRTCAGIGPSPNPMATAAECGWSWMIWRWRPRATREWDRCWNSCGSSWKQAWVPRKSIGSAAA